MRERASSTILVVAAFAMVLAIGKLDSRESAPATSVANPRVEPSTPAKFTPPKIVRRDPAARWQALLAQPASIARDAELAETLEALALVNPDTAGERLRALNETERRGVVAAIFLDSAQRPDRAVELAHEFCRLDPAGSTDHGYAVVWALARAGEFDAAIRFVEQQQARPDESEDPSKWLDRLFGTWAQEQPEAAAARAATLPGESLRHEALRAVAVTWLRRDPAGLATFALRQPEGPERTTLLGAFADL